MSKVITTALGRLLYGLYHHFDSATIWYFGISEGHLQARLTMLQKEVSIAQERVERIEELAQKNGYADVLAILDEPCKEP